jgi:hypothetical protein
LVLRDVERNLEGSRVSFAFEIEEAITMAWNDLTFDELQSVFHNWMNRLRWVIENEGEYITE